MRPDRSRDAFGSGGVVTEPDAVVLSSSVVNFGGDESPSVRNEIGVQVACGTDLQFARGVMCEEASAWSAR